VPTLATRHSINPSAKEALYEVPVATQADVDLAVEHARKAFKTWSKVPFSERGRLLLDFADAIEAHREPLERLLVLE
jgi:acyl-CoA reductase-like NAD-dependent aldehyde dehydrogenase